jgi:D-galactarolactone cycloisomerase
MIQCIRTYRLSQQLEDPFGFSQWHYDIRNALIIEIVDDSGATGWGECYGPAQVTQAAVDGYYSPHLLGWDPLRNEAAWQHCWRAGLDFSLKGVMMGAISGLDMAMLDLKGKLLDVPAAELMGGRLRDRVDCYATGMYFRQIPETELYDVIVNEAQGYVDSGFKALKIKIGKNLGFDKELITLMRRSFPDTRLMADSNHAYDLPEAIEIGRLLDKNNYTWFEEPLSPYHGDKFRQLSDKLDIAIATGECEQTRWGFQQLLGHGGVQIAQPDLAYCGGPTEALKIRSIASSMGINVIPHAWGTLLNLACAAHFLATTYVEPGRAEIQPPLLETDRSDNPMREQMYTRKLAFENGTIAVPTVAGLGVEPDKKAMLEFCVQQTECC